MSKKRKTIAVIDNLDSDCILKTNPVLVQRKKNKFESIEPVEINVQRERYRHRRTGIFVNLVRTKNAESLSFRNSSADSEKHIRDMVSDMQEGWNGINQIAGDKSARLVIQNIMLNNLKANMQTSAKNADQNNCALNKANNLKTYKSHTYLIHIAPDTITVVDHELTSVDMIHCLLIDEGWRNYARTILEFVPARFPGRTLVIQPIDDEIKKIKEYKEALETGRGPCKIYRDIWALNKLNVDIS